ncbi:MAG: NAD-dependent epimerase/dehydratase family protein [Xanthomonadales bacterium]|nr:NAD-dependent epimerase/dehydratase family protein [Xanthomonadales bacterium]
MSPVLVTGAAGFIGAAVSARLLAQGVPVVGIDNFNAYYDVRIKEARAERLQQHPGFTLHRLDLAERGAVAAVMAASRPDRVVHLAAQAGVRYAATDPHAYTRANIDGFLNLLEALRVHPVAHLVYASTSSVYGSNREMPFAESATTDHALTLYAATKKANEVMAHAYAHLFGIPCTGLRFFTVYGPWGRPDMALFKFARAMLSDQPIQLYNHGQHGRSFTYIDDIVEGVLRVLARPAVPDADAADADPGRSRVAPYAIYNIGSETEVPLRRYVELLEQALGRRARIELLPLQPGDVERTSADMGRLRERVAYCPQVPVEVGIQRFVEWFLAHPALTLG